MPKAKALTPVRPNAGLTSYYYRTLDSLIVALIADVQKHICAGYKRRTPEMAQDDSPAVYLRNIISGRLRIWQPRFGRAADALAKYFATEAHKRCDASLIAALKRHGFAHEFVMTRAQNDILQATIAENVSLIKSIGQQYFTNLEGAVMRSVKAGHTIGDLAKEIERIGGVSRKRAHFIARDQNAKATMAMTRARHLEMGITTSQWRHSSGGKTPRPSHVAFNGKNFDTAKGAYIDNQWIQPGELPNCRCVAVAILPFLDK